MYTCFVLFFRQSWDNHYGLQSINQSIVVSWFCCCLLFVSCWSGNGTTVLSTERWNSTWKDVLFPFHYDLISTVHAWHLWLYEQTLYLCVMCIFDVFAVCTVRVHISLYLCVCSSSTTWTNWRGTSDKQSWITMLCIGKEKNQSLFFSGLSSFFSLILQVLKRLTNNKFWNDSQTIYNWFYHWNHFLLWHNVFLCCLACVCLCFVLLLVVGVVGVEFLRGACVQTRKHVRAYFDKLSQPSRAISL